MGSIPLALLAGLVAVDRIIAAADRTPDRPGSQYQAQVQWEKQTYYDAFLGELWCKQKHFSD